MTLKNSKLTFPEVESMRKRQTRWVEQGYPSGEFVRQEALRFGVAFETIRRALRGETFNRTAPVLLGEGEEHPQDDPDDSGAEASLRRLQAALAESPGAKQADAAIEAMKGGFDEP